MDERESRIFPFLLIFWSLMTAVVSFFSSRFTSKSYEEISNATEQHGRVLKEVTGYLTRIIEKTCFTAQLKDDCKHNESTNFTNLEYPPTITIVQISVFSPLLLVIVLIVYFEIGRYRKLSPKTVTTVIICITFESLQVFGYVYFPVFIGKEMGFTGGDVGFMIYFFDIANMGAIWIWCVYTLRKSKDTHVKKRKYKTRLKKSDPVYIVENFIFVEYSTKKRTYRRQTCSYDTLMDNLNVKQLGNRKPVKTQSCATEDVTKSSSSKEAINIRKSNAETIDRTQNVTSQRNALEHTVRVDCVSADKRSSTTHSIVDMTGLAERQTELGQMAIGLERHHSVATTENQATHEEFLQTLDDKRNEYVCIKALLEKLWYPELIGIGRDTRVHNHSKIRVKTIKHITNDNVLNQYNKRKADIKQFATNYCDGKLFSPEEYGIDINGIKTEEAIRRLPKSVFLRIKTDKNINEYFLFYGTDICNIPSIVQKGFEKSKSYRTTLGKGLYFSDHPVKADQSASLKKVGETHTPCCMILARVLLGNPVITKVRNADLTAAQRPPCKVCLSVCGSHSHGNNFDSLIFDEGLFREYVVYENKLAYPEYVIYYDRVYG